MMELASLVRDILRHSTLNNWRSIVNRTMKRKQSGRSRAGDIAAGW